MPKKIDFLVLAVTIKIDAENSKPLDAPPSPLRNLNDPAIKGSIMEIRNVVQAH